MSRREPGTQNVTIRVRRELLRRARMLAARHKVSVSDLLVAQLETLVREDDRYEEALDRALALLETGFHLGGRIEAGRDELHER